MNIVKQTIVERLRPDMSNFLRVLKPDAKPAGKGKLLAHCMFPDNHTNGDANPSLLLFLDSGGYKCQACGAKGSLFDLYGHIHGLDFKQSLHALAERVGIEVNKQIQQRVTGRYDYLKQDGSLGYYKERLEPSRDGKRSKEFIIKGPNGTPGQPENPLLYRLPELMHSNHGDMVIFTEGEKQADLLAKWGLIATTLPHGSGSAWHDSYIAPLLGKQVVVLADNDEAGRRYAEMICQALNDKTASLKIVELPGLCDQTLALYQTAKPGSDQEATDDDDDPDKTYRFGTGKKTRYRPHRVFLSFDTDREVFALAQNPDDAALESLHKIITNMSIIGCAKQSEIVNKASETGGETFGGEKKIISLLKKGIGSFWTTEKGLHNATIYRPIQLGSLAPPIEDEKLPNGNIPIRSAEYCAERTDYFELPKTLIDTEFGSYSEARLQTAKPVYVDLPMF